MCVLLLSNADSHPLDQFSNGINIKKKMTDTMTMNICVCEDMMMVHVWLAGNNKQSIDVWIFNECMMYFGIFFSFFMMFIVAIHYSHIKVIYTLTHKEKDFFLLF